MSNFLTGLSQLNPQVKRHNGGTTTLTLDQNGTTNATMLYVNGVAQTPGIDFNVSGATLTTTSTLPAGTNICTTIQYFNTGIVNTVADNAIGLGQMASGVDGNVISYDASGNPVAVATGSDGQVLTSTGAGSPPAFEALPTGGGFEFLSHITFSSTSTLDINSVITAGYDYEFKAYGIDPTSDSALRTTFSSDNGSSQLGSAYYSGGDSRGAQFNCQNLAYGCLSYPGTIFDESLGQVHFEMSLINPMDASHYTVMMFRSFGSNTSGQPGLGGSGYTEHRSNVAINAVRLYPSAGNWATGEVYIYRRKNA